MREGKYPTQASFLLNNVTNMCDTPLDLSLKGLSIDMQHLYVANQIKMYIFKNIENHNFLYILHKYFMKQFEWNNHNYFTTLNSQSNQHRWKKRISYWPCALLWRSSRRLELSAVFRGGFLSNRPAVHSAEKTSVQVIPRLIRTAHVR